MPISDDLPLQVAVIASEAARQPSAATPSATDTDSTIPVLTVSANAAEHSTAGLAAPVAAPPQSSAGTGAAQRHAAPGAAHREGSRQRGDAEVRGAAGMTNVHNALLAAALADGLESEMLLVVRRAQVARALHSPPSPRIPQCLDYHRCLAPVVQSLLRPSFELLDQKPLLIQRDESAR